MKTTMKRLPIAAIAALFALATAFPTAAKSETLIEATGEVTLSDGDVLTGTCGSETHVSIAAGATVTLRDVNITAIPQDQAHMWPGINCEGSATIILEGANAVKGGYEGCPGVMVPDGCTLVIQGDGSLDVSSNGYGAGIGAAYGLSCGNIIIAGGIITATGGAGAAGIGGTQYSTCGTISVLGGTVNATGGNYAPGIGSGLTGTCGAILIGGGTVVATGGDEAPGIGAGGDGVCGDVTISESVFCVTAQGGHYNEGTPYSVGAGTSGSCGTVTVEKETGNDMGAITVNPFVYNPCITNITSLADWNAFASRVNRGVDSYKGITVTLAADISVSTMAGASSCPFSGTFEGGGHSIAVDISAGDTIGALFGAIRGATIRNLNVSGSVAGDKHSAGLVGSCVNVSTNAIIDCTVSVAVSAAEYAGGIVGHGGNGNENLLKDCVFSGTISGFSGFAGGILGWSDRMTLAITNCLMKGSFVPASGGKYHPVACKNGGSTVNATVSRVYYLNTMQPTAPSGNVISAGVPVSATLVPFEWTGAVTAADGLTYYTEAQVITLTAGTGLVTLQDGDILTGQGGENTRVQIAAGASVMLRNVTDAEIAEDDSHQWAGVTCLGDAVITLKELNWVEGGHGDFPGFYVPQGSVLHFQGDGRLDTRSKGSCAGIVGDVTVGEGLLDVTDGNTRRILPGITIAEDKSNAEVIAEHNNRLEAVCLGGRTLHRDGTWNTLCLPFSMDADQIAASPLAGAHIMELLGVGVDGDMLEVDFSTRYSIEAGTPYLVVWDAGLTIRSAADWEAFAGNVSGGKSYEGCLVKLAADINVTKMVGEEERPFRGTFDGNGHTITVNLNGGDEGIALFYELEDATVQNVRVKGSISSSYHRPATFASFAKGDTNIRNCWSEVAISASYTGWVDAGGIVARVTSGGRLTITDCAFTGVIAYARGTTYEGAGMVGWTQHDAEAFVVNSLFAPSSVKIGKEHADSYVFVSGYTRGNIVNSFYNSVADSSLLNKEGVSVGNRTGAALAAALGANWEVGSSGAAPKMNAPCGVVNDGSDIVNPVFERVIVSADTADIDSGLLLFAGTTSPMALGSSGGLPLIFGDDGTLTSPSSGAKINSCRAFFRLRTDELDEEQTITRYVLNFGGDATMTIAGEIEMPSASGYARWSAENNIAGAWNETDSNGIHNVFRYAFNKPTGVFVDPALLAITVEEGQAVIHTPPLVNSEGFVFSIVASDALDGAETAEYSLNSSGRTAIPTTGKPARFFRLRAAEE